MNLVWALGLLAIGAIVVWRGSFLLETAADRLAAHYHYPDYASTSCGWVI